MPKRTQRRRDISWRRAPEGSVDVMKPRVKWHPLAWVVGCMCEPHPPGVPVVLSVHSTWEGAMRAANEHYNARHRGAS